MTSDSDVHASHSRANTLSTLLDKRQIDPVISLVGTELLSRLWQYNVLLAL
jgi:hypothetical protein